MDTAEVLAAAAGLAGRQKTAKRAIQAGWSACHAERGLINAVFDAWQASEDVKYWSEFSGCLYRRLKTPDMVADSLSKASRAALEPAMPP